MGIDEKYDQLKESIKSPGKAVIAYSGGVDSTFLLKIAVDVLGPENVLACLGVSPSLGKSQKRTALDTAKEIGVKVREITVRELEDENYSRNKADRCFHCKSHIYGLLCQIAKEENIEHVLCGSNFDDKDDFRPGNRAANVFGVRAPLMEAGLTKADIRHLSKQLGLSTAEMPASPCLASRISYGVNITAEKLDQVDNAEAFIKSLGFSELRVRHHGEIARIEVKKDQIEKIIAEPVRTKVIKKLKELGFKYVSIDMQGFRSGSLNESLTEEEKQKYL
ncbi:MAG: ATP-dependent sacrificial sulfur transferase LarE [Sedimentisphaerales bacterium]|nr:ATP-dependent sacrificial sulfur transferase LarE [Sedimentisphaerales bacterium]